MKSLRKSIHYWGKLLALWNALAILSTVKKKCNVCFWLFSQKKLRPRNEQRENELIISFLRCLYEEKQKEHSHTGEPKQVSTFWPLELSMGLLTVYTESRDSVIGGSLLFPRFHCTSGENERVLVVFKDGERYFWATVSGRNWSLLPLSFELRLHYFTADRVLNSWTTF